MPNANDLPTAYESKPLVCSSGCHSRSKELFLAAVYWHVALVLGSFAALATSPDLADYGYPSIENPSDTGFKGERNCTVEIGGSGCSVQATLPGSFSFPSNPSASNPTERIDCWPKSCACHISSLTKVESTLTSDEASGNLVTDSVKFEEIPADATLRFNNVESEVHLS